MTLANHANGKIIFLDENINITWLEGIRQCWLPGDKYIWLYEQIECGTIITKCFAMTVTGHTLIIVYRSIDKCANIQTSKQHK